MRALAVAAYALFVAAPFAPAFAADSDKPLLAPDAVADGIVSRKAAYQAVKKTPSLGEPVAAAVNRSQRDMSERALMRLVFEGDDG